MASPLSNYLKAYRQHKGLTQIEVATLLGFDASVNISRYERGARLPHLEGALALEMLFDVRTADLFPAFTGEIAEDLLRHVRRLQDELGEGTTLKDQHKAASLADMHARLKTYRRPHK